MKALETLELEAKGGNWSHAYLFIGNNEEVLNEIINFVINKKDCQKSDISIVEPESLSGKAGEVKIEAVRSLLHEIYLSPQGKSRIAIIKHCERLNNSSGNILLKSLEEPPSYLTFILTADNNSVLSTIRSRCRVINIKGPSSSIAGNQDERYSDFLNQGFFEATKEIDKIVKDENVNEFMAELEYLLRKKMLDTKKKTYVSFLDSLLRTKKEIANNANPKLALECLFLELKEVK